MNESSVLHAVRWKWLYIIVFKKLFLGLQEVEKLSIRSCEKNKNHVTQNNQQSNIKQKTVPKEKSPSVLASFNLQKNSSVFSHLTAGIKQHCSEKVIMSVEAHSKTADKKRG